MVVLFTTLGVNCSTSYGHAVILGLTGAVEQLTVALATVYGVFLSDYFSEYLPVHVRLPVILPRVRIGHLLKACNMLSVALMAVHKRIH